MDFPGGSVVKNSPANAGDVGLILGLERSPGGRHGHPLQYSPMENPMDRRAWQATVHSLADLTSLRKHERVPQVPMQLESDPKL